MPLKLRVDAEAELVRLEASGVVTQRDLLEALEPMIRHPGFRRGMPQLVDLSQAENADLTADEMRALSAAFAKEQARLGDGRVAIVAPKPVLFGISRMYEALADRAPATLRVFAEMETALAWLREPDDAD